MSLVKRLTCRVCCKKFLLSLKTISGEGWGFMIFGFEVYVIFYFWDFGIFCMGFAYIFRVFIFFGYFYEYDYLISVIFGF